MEKDKPVNITVALPSAATRHAIRVRAAAADMTPSAWIRKLIDRELAAGEEDPA